MESENHHDFETTLGTFEHPRYEIVPTGDVFDGAEAVRGYFDDSRTAFPDQRNELIALHHADDGVIVEFELKGTHQGPLRGIPPTGKEFTCRTAAFFLFDGRRAGLRARLLRRRHDHGPARPDPARPVAAGRGRRMSAEANKQLIERFYSAFGRKDGHEMAECYASDVHFSDPVFPDLRGPRAGAMWDMLTEAPGDLRIELLEHDADETTGSAHWRAHYVFSQTGRPVVNDVRARPSGSRTG